MLTPTFEIEQTDDYLLLSVHAPYTKVSEVDIFVENDNFTFYAKPYFLRLKFGGNLCDDESSCRYISDKGDYLIKLKKVESGETFKDLDLLTSLLQVKEKKHPTIEIIDKDSESADEKFEAALIDWCNSDNNVDDQCLLPSYGYGFANQKHNVIAKLQDDLDIVSIKDPDETNFCKRKMLREESENDKFDSDHYLADLYESDEIDLLISFKPWWKKTSKDKFVFTDEEKVLLQSLPNKEYLLNKHDCKLAYLGLLDILFAYAYHARTTEEDMDNVEAAWTIRTVSPTLSWCDTQTSVPNCLIACARRSLSYPQYRNWALIKTIISDVTCILRNGRRSIIRCLLSTLSVFKSCTDAPCYILNDLYITDYIVWLQNSKSSEEALKSLLDAIVKTDITKEDVNLDLKCLERAAELVLQEQEESTEDDSESETSSESESDSDSVRSDEDLTKALESVSISDQAEAKNSKIESDISILPDSSTKRPLIEVINEETFSE